MKLNTRELKLLRRVLSERLAGRVDRELARLSAKLRRKE
jgi:hypothetical protein